MSESASHDIVTVPEEDVRTTDREVLDAILASQIRTETVVRTFVAEVKPILDTIQEKGIMGLMSMMR